MFGITDRYFLYEVGRAFGAIVSSLLLIVASMLFLRTLEEVNVGALNTGLLLQFLGLQLIRDAADLLPPAYFLAVLMAVGRMGRDSELIAFGASGVGLARLYRALLFFALPVSLLTAWFALELKPWAAAEIQNLRDRQEDQSYQIAGIKPGRFYQTPDGRLTVYVEEILDNQELRTVFIEDTRARPVRRVVTAPRGQHWFDPESGDHFVTLLDGWRYDGQAGQLDYTVGRFERYNVRIEAKELKGRDRRKRSGVPTLELIGSTDLADRAELEHRLAGPIAIFTLALIALPLSTTSPRQGASGRIFLALLTYFSFFNLQRLAENWIETGITPLWLTSYWYQLLVLGLVYLMLLPESYVVRRARLFIGR